MSRNHFPVNNWYENRTVAVDLDNCLLLANGDPNEALIEALLAMSAHYWNLIVYSARPPACHDEVMALLRKADLHEMFSQVVLGAKPAADVFVDDKGFLPPPVVLEDIAELRTSSLGYGDWTLGLAQGQLSEDMARCWENPEPPDSSYAIDDNGFLVVVPVSGGVDSTVAYLMAREAGLPVDPMYVNTGAPYSAVEYATVVTLLGECWQRWVEVDFQRWQHVDRARNAVIVMECAKYLRESDAWGEVWFGNLAEWAETPISGGDKTHRFFVSMQHILSHQGYDVQLCSPLGGMTKADAVRWADQRGYRDILLGTRSCYAADGPSCGRCRSCFRRWLAFEIALEVYDIATAWPNGFDFDEQVGLYRLAERRGVEWDPRRTAEIDHLIGKGVTCSS